MNDIAKLIERLKHSAAVWAAWDTWELTNGPAPEAVNHAEYSRTCDEAADELSRLTASPPPEEIAAIADALWRLARQAESAFPASAYRAERSLHGKAAAALEQTARESLEWKAAAYAKTMEKADLQERIDEQAREIEGLKAQPIPGEIAIICDWLRNSPLLRHTCKDAASLLEQQALENERLKKTWIDPETKFVWEPPTAWAYAVACKDLESKRQRIGELETENDTLRNSVEAVRAEYLQRCMNAAARIRALSQPAGEGGE